MQAGRTADPKTKASLNPETKVRIEVTQTHTREWSEQSNFVQP